MATSIAEPLRHERFWFSDGNLLLLVHNTLYFIHRFFFETYATNFSLKEQVFEGTGTTPCVLDPDVTGVDFDRLLACLYPRALWVEETQTCEEWASVLKLAAKWGFESLRTRALSKIVETAISPVDKVVLGRQYDLPDLLLPGYVSLCQSTVPISYEDALRLGMQDVVDIYHIRHQLYGSDIAPVSYEEALAKVKAYAYQAGDPKDAEIAPPSGPNAVFVVMPGARPTDDEYNGGQVNSVSGEDSPSSEALPDASEHDGPEAALNNEHGLDDAYISTNGKEKNEETKTPRADSVHSEKNDLGTPTDAGYDVVSEPRTCGDESDGELVTYNPRAGSSSSETLSGVPSDTTNGLQAQPEAVDPCIVHEQHDTIAPGTHPEFVPSDIAIVVVERDGALIPFAEQAPSRIADVVIEQNDVAAPNAKSGVVPSNGTISEASGSAPLSAGVEQSFPYLDNLTTENFNSLSDQMMQRLNELKDSQTLLQTTRLFVTTVVEERGLSELALRLCAKAMTKISRKINDKVEGKVLVGPILFREYLGQACRESLENAFMESRVTADEIEARRHRLIEFVVELSKRDLLTIDIVHKMVTVLLADQRNDEKAMALSMLLPKIGPSWDKDTGKRKRRINEWFQSIATLARNHGSLLARGVLLDLIQLRQCGWSR